MRSGAGDGVRDSQTVPLMAIIAAEVKAIHNSCEVGQRTQQRCGGASHWKGQPCFGEELFIKSDEGGSKSDLGN